LKSKNRRDIYKIIFIVFLFGLILGSYTLIALFQQSTWQEPENDVWLRNTNAATVVFREIDAMGSIGDAETKVIINETLDPIAVSSPQEYLIVTKVDAAILFELNYNSSLADEYDIVFQYKIFEQHSVAGELQDSQLVSSEIVNLHQRKGEKIAIFINWTYTGNSYPKDYGYLQFYTLELLDVIVTINQTHFYLETAQTVLLGIMFPISVAPYSVFRMEAKTANDLMLTSVPPEGVDQDNDNVPDVNDPNPDDPDTDHDGLTDGVEITLKTDPTNSDTDGDGFSDGAEVNLYHTDPLDPDSMPNIWHPAMDEQDNYLLFWVCASLPILGGLMLTIFLFLRRRY